MINQENTIDAIDAVNEANEAFASEAQFILIGQSGAGKDYILNKMSKEMGIPKLVSHTTRPPRPNEVNGVDYVFEDSFDPEVNEYVEYRAYQTIENGEPATWYYWLTPSSLDDVPYIGILDYEGARQLKEWSYKELGHRPAFVYVWASPSTLQERARMRQGYEEEEFTRRLNKDLAWEEDAMAFCDFVIINDSWENVPEEVFDGISKDE